MFSYTEILEEIYMHSPPGMLDSNGMKICKRKKALYGLKLDMSKWVPTCEPIWLTMGSG